MSKPTLLIDGDLYLHRGTAAVEKEVRWDEENHMLFSNEEEGWTAVTYALEQLMDRFDVPQSRCIVTLSDPPLFRTSVDPTYKAKRVDTRKPVAFTAVRERIEAEWEVRKFPGLEADDVMGILATKGKDTIICSADKDMRQIPGRVWNGKDLLVIEEHEADFWFLMQTLTGDTSDGYKGCPGIGPAKAERLLGHEGTIETWWPKVVEEYQKAGLTEADAIVQARLARILRAEDWDFIKKVPKLWTPPATSKAAPSAESEQSAS